MGKFAETLESESWLRSEYEQKKRSVHEIASEVGASVGWVSVWLGRFSIETRSGPERIFEDRKCGFCEGRFRPRRLQICCSMSCARKMKFKSTLHCEEWVRARYLDEGLSTREIARLAGSEDFAVGLALKRFGIKARPHQEAKKLLYDRKGRKYVSRSEMIAAYGGRCECCGEAEPEFLTLDHVGGGGAAHRRACREAGKNPTLRIRQELKAASWPKDKYRLLCMNCNFATARGKICPHQLKKEPQPPKET